MKTQIKMYSATPSKNLKSIVNNIEIMEYNYTI